jgi:flavin-dependent dehydrogenase
MGATADVVVIGGGPAGSALAMRLARQNIHVIQLERRIFLAPANDRFRSGEGLLPRTRRALAALGVADCGSSWALSQIAQVRMHWPDGEWTNNSIARHGGIVQIDRERFDHALFCAARSAGVDGREGWQARRLVRDASGAIAGVLVQPPAGQPLQLLRAPIIVDAGGRNALALRELKLRVPSADGDFFAISMFFDQVAELPSDVWEMHLFNPQQLTIIQMSRLCEGVVRCALGTASQFKRAARCSSQAFFWKCIEQMPDLARRLADSHVIGRPFIRASIGYRVRQVAFDGLLLVGDAAGYLNPLFGDGILRALLMAKHAASTISAALRSGDCSRAAFARYALRRAALDRVDWIVKCSLLRMHEYPQALTRYGRARLVRNALMAALMRG